MHTPALARFSTHLRYALPEAHHAALAWAAGLGAALAGTVALVQWRAGHAALLRPEWAVALAALALLAVEPGVSRWPRWAALAAATAGWALLTGPERWAAFVVGFLLVVPGTPYFRVARLTGAALGGAWFTWVHDAVPHFSRLPTTGLSLALDLSAGLFVALGALLAFVEVRPDVVDARLADAGPVAERTRERWQRVQVQLARLSEGAQRSRGRALATSAAERVLATAEELSRVGACLTDPELREARGELARLDVLVAEQTDATTRAHLSQARQLHSDTLEQLDGLERRRARLEARLEAESAVVEKIARALELAPATPEARHEALSRLSALLAATPTA